MLETNVRDLAQRMTQVQNEERRKQIQKEIQQIKAEMASRGTLQSGGTIKRIFEACSHELEVRAQIIWQTIHKVLMTSGVQKTDTLADDLKAEVEANLQTDDLRRHLEDTVRAIKAPFSPSLDEAFNNTLRKMDAEIDLFVLSLSSPAANKMEREKDTSYDRFFRFLKNHPVYGPLIIVGVIIITFATFTVSVEKLSDLVSKLRQVLHPKIETPSTQEPTSGDRPVLKNTYKDTVNALIQKCNQPITGFKVKPEVFVPRWIGILTQLRRERTEYDLETLMSMNGRAVVGYPNEERVDEAKFTLNCLENEGYLKIIKTNSNFTWGGASHENLRFEFIDR